MTDLPLRSFRALPFGAALLLLARAASADPLGAPLLELGVEESEPALGLLDPERYPRPAPQPIYGGDVVQPCGWPTTVSLGGCTGTLVHPEVVVFAAHCGWVSSVTFGDNAYTPAFSVGTVDCKTHPSYFGEGSGRDIAFCRLAQPVTNVPIVPILMGCEVDALQEGRPVVAVGFGQANDNRGDGPKRQVEMPFHRIQNDEAFIGGSGRDTCFGDSGGPVYVKLDDGSWRVFGITSYGDADTCGGGGYYSMMHIGVDWIEQSTGLDVTPCTDSAGQWMPTAACTAFPMDPGTGAGDWSLGCATGNGSGPSATCGSPFGNGGAGGSGGSGSGGSAAGGGSGFGGTGSGGTGAGGTGAGGAGASGGAGTGGGVGGDAGSGFGGSSGSAGAAGSGTGGSGVDCETLPTCFETCVCYTANASGCQVACAPSPGAGGSSGSSGGGSARPRSDSAEEGGCACRAPAPGTGSAAALIALAGLAFAVGRRRR